MFVFLAVCGSIQCVTMKLIIKCIFIDRIVSYFFVLGSVGSGNWSDTASTKRSASTAASHHKVKLCIQ